MRGTVFVKLQTYVVEKLKLGNEAWENFLEKARVKSNKHYMRLHSYPDTEIDRILAAIGEHTGMTRSQILDDFGQYIGHYVIGCYSAILSPTWTTLDAVENTPFQIKEIFTTLTWDDSPPFYEVMRPSQNEVVVRYSSSRKMCDLLAGVIKATALFYKEDIIIFQPRCMLKGDIECNLHIQLTGKSAEKVQAFEDKKADAAGRGRITPIENTDAAVI